MFNSKVLEGDIVEIYDDERFDDKRRQEIPTKLIREYIAEYSRAIRFIQDWKQGRFIITKTEYLRMPAKLARIIDVYEGVVAEMKAAKEKQ